MSLCLFDFWLNATCEQSVSLTKVFFGRLEFVLYQFTFLILSLVTDNLIANDIRLQLELTSVLLENNVFTI